MKTTKFLRLEDAVRELRESTTVLPNNAIKCEMTLGWKIEKRGIVHTLHRKLREAEDAKCIPVKKSNHIKSHSYTRNIEET